MTSPSPDPEPASTSAAAAADELPLLVKRAERLADEKNRQIDIEDVIGAAA